MIVATQLRAGMSIIYEGEPYKVLSVQHVTPGKGRGMVQSKLRNLKTGIGTENRFRSDEKIERAHLEQHEMEYLYSEGESHHFMNSSTYEQAELGSEILGDNVYYLIPNVKFMIEYFDGAPVGVEPPKVVELKIVETAPNIKGATVSSSYKPATTETGLVVNVPPFIESGEVIRVDTDGGTYLERARA